MKLKSILLSSVIYISSSTMASSSVREIELKSPECPEKMNKTECVYYKEGWASARDDDRQELKANVDRHSEFFEERYEPAFRKGYELYWKE